MKLQTYNILVDEILDSKRYLHDLTIDTDVGIQTSGFENLLYCDLKNFYFLPQNSCAITDVMTRLQSKESASLCLGNLCLGGKKAHSEQVHM